MTSSARQDRSGHHAAEGLGGGAARERGAVPLGLRVFSCLGLRRRGNGHLPESRMARDAGKIGDDCLGEFWQRTLHPDDLPSYIAKWQVSVATGRLSRPKRAFAGTTSIGGSWPVRRGSELLRPDLGRHRHGHRRPQTTAERPGGWEAAEEAAYAKDRFPRGAFASCGLL